MSTTEYDVIVVGGGPGGYVAAIRAAQRGLRTALVEREHLGGICLNWGCIPTKTLLHAAEAWHSLEVLSALGIQTGERTFDLGVMVGRSRAVAGKLSQGVRLLLRKHRVTVLEGDGSLVGPGSVVVKSRDETLRLSAPHVILATGARPRELPDATADGTRVWNYRHALSPISLPASLAIIGAGAIGMEFASFYAALGTAVTVVEAQPRVLPTEDAEISAFVERAYRKRGIQFLIGTRIEAIEQTENGVVLDVSDPQEKHRLATECMLVSIGVIANTESIGLEHTGAETENGFIKVDSDGRTSQPGLYAIGDVTGAPCLAHKAMHEALTCVDSIVDGETAHASQRSSIPACTYGYPQTASVGLTEDQAKEKGRAIRVGRFPFQGNGKALAIGDADGFIKTIFDRESGELLGAHMVGPQVTELIHSLVLARELEATEMELIQTVFPHPTLSEAVHESVLEALDRPLHI
ncbi:dihydrolipoyl dehydrogenase [Ralstonia syzygii]|uniref:Dihydrolipoyl dehydrogenase n=1 Tax=Ralstonia syzygii R24 TaxID=907261 RepID=G3A7I8_9RALS|nr:dihydrolipoyl dehydrogenase [Ralstonia syzygii]CCA86462.1 dihydrolipoamide dehydrogenase [Ralstonia syzygii R24]